jgi:hypothetical protein
MKKRKAKYKPDVSKVPEKLKKQTAAEMRAGAAAAKRSGKLEKGHKTVGYVDNSPGALPDIDDTVQMPQQVRRQRAVANAHFGVVGHDAHLFQLEQHLAAATKLIGELWR